MKILIVGAGIGGLTAASALAQAGHTVEMVDQRKDWAITGWGLSLTGPALRALRAINVAHRCVEEGYGISEVASCTASGTVLSVVQPPPIAGPDLPPQAGIMRPVLHGILRDRAAALGIVPRLSTTIDQLVQDETKVQVRFNSGETAQYDLVIGADGVASKVRQLIGIEMQAKYLGQVGWRALVQRPAWATRLNAYSGDGQTTGLIPLSKTHAYVWIVETREDHRLEPGVDLAAKMRALLAPFPVLNELSATITDSAAVVRRQIEVLLVPKPWHRGRVVLLGDAVHTPSPQLVSGAAMAIEDGVVLAEELARNSLPVALDAYVTRRFDRCRMLHEACVEISRLQVAGEHAAWPVVAGKTYGALGAPA